MNKTRLFFDIDKETKWLNALAEKGYRLKERSCFTYTFEQCEKGKYIYQVEKRGIEFTSQEKKYIDFLRDVDINFVGHTLGYYYFEKENDDKPFALYSDANSKVKHYKSIMKLLAILAVINISIINTHFTDPTGPWILGVSLSFWSNVVCLLAIIMTCIKYSNRIKTIKKEERIQEDILIG